MGYKTYQIKGHYHWWKIYRKIRNKYGFDLKPYINKRNGLITINDTNYEAITKVLEEYLIPLGLVIEITE